MFKAKTLTDHLIEEERLGHTTAELTLVLGQIENATKIIGSHVKQTGLVDMLGKTGTTNAYNEEVQKLDAFSNDLLIRLLIDSGQVASVLSEELESPVRAPAHYESTYMVCIDPLDGSSNVDINAPLGTIFSIYQNQENALQPGKNQVVAGYVLYGPSIMFVYSNGNGVHGFTLDPSIGTFLLSHPDMRVPEEGDIYAINEASSPYFSQDITSYLGAIKTKGAKARYIGCMVADVHRTLIKGGLFLYPSDQKNPDGKIRLLYEVNPMSFLIEQAGGLATSNGTNPLTIIPTNGTQRVPIVLGSKNNVLEYLSFLS